MLIHRKLVLRMHDDDLIPKLFTIWNAFFEMSNETFLYTVNEEDTILQKILEVCETWYKFEAAPDNKVTPIIHA